MGVNRIGKDQSSLTYTITSAAAEGVVINNNDGTFTFDPDGDFEDLALNATRDVGFTYEATDSHGAVSNEATVTVTVTGENDDPTAGDQSVNAQEDGPVVSQAFAGDDIDSDDDQSSLDYTITSAVTEGSVTNNANGTFTFDPDLDFQDLDDGETRDVTFTYRATDSHGAVSNEATVTVTVTGVNESVAGPIIGTPDNDTLLGTNNADVVLGLGGNDVIGTFGGDDTLIGGTGNDALIGGPGDDILFGDLESLPSTPPLDENGFYYVTLGGDDRDFLQDMARDSEGNIYISGFTFGALPGQTNLGTEDAYIAKFDSVGNLLNVHQFGSNELDAAKGVAVDSEGYVYVAGISYGEMNGAFHEGSSWNTYLVKFDTDLSEIWTERVDISGASVARDIFIDANDNIYVAGDSTGSFPDTSNGGLNDWFIARFDGDRTQDLAIQIDGNGESDNGYEVAVDSAGNIYMVGDYEGPHGTQKPYFAKFDPAGNLLYEQNLSDSYGHALAIEVTDDRVFAASKLGFGSSGDIQVDAFDHFGNPKWSQTYSWGGMEVPTDLTVAPDGTLYVSGYTTSGVDGNASHGGHDVFFLQLDSMSGTILDSGQIGTPGNENRNDETPPHIEFAPDGTMYLASYTTGNIGGNQNQGAEDAFLAIRPDIEFTSREFSETAIVDPTDGSADDIFGRSVSISGDRMIVGAPHDDPDGSFNEGSAYIYHFDGSNWTQEQKLTGTNSNIQDTYGIDVSISGDFAIVGAHAYNAFGNDDGAAFVYRYDGNTWVEDERLTASDNTSGGKHNYGIGVSIDGNVAIVGAQGDDSVAGGDAGSAYIYRYDGADWIEEQKLVANDASASDSFGVSVSVDGNLAIVGAKGVNHVGGNFDGAAYIFRYDGNSWSQEDKIVADDAFADLGFGHAVSISGNVAVVGALGPTDTISAAYVFRKVGDDWVQETKLTGFDTIPGDTFGRDVSISGNTIVVGAQTDDTDAGVNAGSAYVFRYDGTTWVETVKLTASDGEASDQFGGTVSVDGDRVAVGATMDDTIESGGAYVFDSLSGNDELYGGDGDDFLSGGPGADTLAGGDGDDTAVFSGAMSGYNISTSGNSFIVNNTAPLSNGDDGTDTLTGIETLQFSDGDIAITEGVNFTEFQVNTFTADDQKTVSVADLGDGGFVSVWRSFGQDGDNLGIFGQRFEADGTPVLKVDGTPDEFQVNTTTARASFLSACRAS